MTIKLFNLFDLMKASRNELKQLQSICDSKEVQSLIRNSIPYNIECMVQ